MSNWSGTYTNPNSTGISTGLNGSNTLNDTTVNWGILDNQYIKITAGTGVGQEKLILGNSTISVIIEGNWDIIPDVTSQYEIVLLLKDGDHIVAATNINTGVISELEDNATIYIDGNYTFTLEDADEIRWNKSRDTVVTFEANNRDVQGKLNFWGGFIYDRFATGIVKLSYLHIRDAGTGIVIEPSVALGDGSDTHHLIMSECYHPIGLWSPSALSQDVVIKNILGVRNRGNATYNNLNNPYSLTFEHIWVNG